MEFRLPGDFLHSSAEQPKHAHSVTWTVVGDVLRDLFKVTRHEG